MFEKELQKFTKKELLQLENRGEGFLIELPNKNGHTSNLIFGPDHLDLYFEISYSKTEKPFLFWTTIMVLRNLS